MADGLGVVVGDGNGDGDGRPNPEEFKVHMRTVTAGEDSAMRHDDFVGSYNHTGRVKLNMKKWTPSKQPEVGDNAFRADDWMGSGKAPRKTWTVKSASNSHEAADDTTKPGDLISSNSESSGRKWKPRPKDQAAQPPWMGPQSGSSPVKRFSTASSWKPRSPAPPVNATREPAKESSAHDCERTSAGTQLSNQSQVSEAVEGLSNSFSHHSVTSPTTTPMHSPRLDPSVSNVDDSMPRDEEDDEVIEPLSSSRPADHHSDSDDSEEYEMASTDGDSDDEETTKPPEELTAVPAPADPAAGYVVEDDDRPDPEEYKIQMRTVHAGEDSAIRHDDFVGSYNHTGRVKLQKKMWAPSKKPDVGDNAFRADDWMGSGKPQRKSWMPKSSNSVDATKPECVRSKSENSRQWAAPSKKEEVTPLNVMPTKPLEESSKGTTPELMPESRPVVEEKAELSVVEPNASEAAPTAEDVQEAEIEGSEPFRGPSSPTATTPTVPATAAGYVADDDYDRPDPEEYKIHMRTVHAGEDSAMRHDDFVGSYNHTGRVKLQKKMWAPSKKPDVGDNAFRADDWMGSGGKKAKSWKVKN